MSDELCLVCHQPHNSNVKLGCNGHPERSYIKTLRKRQEQIERLERQLEKAIELIEDAHKSGRIGWQLKMDRYREIIAEVK